MSRWYTPGRGDVPRLLSLAVEALEGEGLGPPARHIALVRGGGVATILVQRTAFSQGDLDALQQECDRRCFEPLFLPGRIAADGLEALERGADAWRAHVAAHPSEDLSAPSDDRPFFFYRTRPADWLAPRALLGWAGGPGRFRIRHDDPHHLLVLVLVVTLLLASSLLVLPALWLRRRERAAAPRPVALLYMALIGVAFMLVEVALLVRFAIVLGHPVLALVVVLPALLVASGIGSIGTSVLPRRAGVALAALPLLLLLLAFAIGGFAQRIAPLGVAGRAGLAAAAILLAGVPMGAALPAGIARSSGPGARATPLLFAVNGAFSVLGSVLGMIALLNLGARSTLLAGAAAYGAAALLLPFLRPPRRQGPTARAARRPAGWPRPAQAPREHRPTPAAGASQASTRGGRGDHGSSFRGLRT